MLRLECIIAPIVERWCWLVFLILKCVFLVPNWSIPAWTNRKINPNLKQLFPRGSKDFLDLNPDGGGSPPIVERSPSSGPLAKKKTKDSDTGKYVVRITSYRVILLDEDNICEKYHVDACRYAGILLTDAPDKTHIIPLQKKVAHKNQQKTLIEITYDANPIPN